MFTLASKKLQEIRNSGTQGGPAWAWTPLIFLGPGTAWSGNDELLHATLVRSHFSCLPFLVQS